MCRVELGIFRYPRLCNGRDKWTEVDRFFLHAFTLFYKVTACGNRRRFFRRDFYYYFDLRSIPSGTAPTLSHPH